MIYKNYPAELKGALRKLKSSLSHCSSSGSLNPLKKSQVNEISGIIEDIIQACQKHHLDLTEVRSDEDALKNNDLFLTITQWQNKSNDNEVSAEQTRRKWIIQLIDAGYDLNRQNSMGWRPLNWAVFAESEDFFDFLQPYCHQLDDPNKSSWTLFQHAIMGGGRMAHKVMALGADIKSLTPTGLTALCFCVQYGNRPDNIALFKTLINMGEDDRQLRHHIDGSSRLNYEEKAALKDWLVGAKIAKKEQLAIEKAMAGSKKKKSSALKSSESTSPSAEMIKPKRHRI